MQEKVKPRLPFSYVYIWAVVVYSISLIAAYRLGIRFSDNSLSFFWQYLDIELLKADLAKSLWNLHSQPPLFNAYLGITLKLFPEAYKLAFTIGFAAMGLALVLGVTWILEACCVPRLICAIAVAVFTLLPSMMVYTNWLFYTLPVSFLLVTASAALGLYVKNRNVLFAHAFAWCCCCAMLLRATYHPIWYAAVVFSLFAILDRTIWKHLVVASLVPFIIVNAWMAKNFVQVRMYSTSSWVGMNMARGIDLPQVEANELIDAGVLPPVWTVGPFQRAINYEGEGYFHPLDSIGLHPSDGSPYKANGEPNFNHREYARISRDMLSGVLGYVKRNPGRYLERIARSMALYFQPGPNSTHFLVQYDFSKVTEYKDAATRALFFGRPFLAYNGQAPGFTLLMVAYPLLICYGLIRGLIGARRSVVAQDNAGARRSVGSQGFAGARHLDSKGQEGTADKGRTHTSLLPIIVFAALTALWGLAAANIAENGENDRMRWETDALVLIIFCCWASAVWERLRVALRARFGAGKESDRTYRP